MRSQRAPVPSAKARANAGLDFENPAEGPSISEQALSIPASTSTTNKPPQATASRPTKPRKAKGRAKKKNTSITSNINKEGPEGLKKPLKLYSILSQTKSAKQLRRDPATALFPLVAKQYASWDEADMEPLEGISGENSYADGALPAAPLEPEGVTLDGYYSHLEFTPMPRTIHEGQVNLPADLTDPLTLFTIFFSYEHVETFVRSTNKYAEEETELERRGHSLSDHSRFLEWKPLTIKETYTFLGILILIGSDRRPRLEDYWKVPRAAGETPSGFHNYMGLKRFQVIHKLFTASPISANEPCHDPPRRAPTPKRKPTARGARPATNISDRGGLSPGHWAKVEPLATHIREICMRVYTPGTHITIDEIMLAFRGRSKDITKLKNKPISEGFKNWVLAEHGYVWNWEWHSVNKGSEGVRESLNSRIPEELPETQRMIMRLALTLPASTHDFILYLDNLFTSLPLAKALKEASIGVTGTTRKNTKGTPP